MKWHQKPTSKMKTTVIDRRKRTTRFFISNAFISNTRLRLAKYQANAKQHPEAEFVLFENYSHSPFTLSSKHNRTYPKK